MLNGDGETPLPFRRSLDKAAATAPADKSSQLQPAVQAGASKRCNTSFSSDSAHVPLPALPLSHDATDVPMHSKSLTSPTQRIPTISPIAIPKGVPTQAAAPPPRKHSFTAQAQQDPAASRPANQPANQAARQDNSFSSSLTAAQQPDTAAPSEVGSSASPAAPNGAEVWRSNPTYGTASSGGNHPSSSGIYSPSGGIHSSSGGVHSSGGGLHSSSGGIPSSSSGDMPSNYRASQSLPSFKAFTSVDRKLTDSWRAKLLEELGDESDSEHGADMRTPLPVVSEHDSLPCLTLDWGLQNNEPKPAALNSAPHAPLASFQATFDSSTAPAQTHLSSSSARSLTHAWSSDALSSAQHPAADFPGHTSMTPAPLPAHTPGNIPTRADDPLQHPWQPHQHGQTDRARALQDLPQLQSAANAQAASNTAVGQQPGNSLPPVCVSPVSLLSQSSLEVVKARSNMLDIPSAELLDSILDFANAVCGEQQTDTAYSPLKVSTPPPLSPLFKPTAICLLHCSNRSGT